MRIERLVEESRKNGESPHIYIPSSYRTNSGKAMAARTRTGNEGSVKAAVAALKTTSRF
jgi:hypothetical protein